MRAYAIQAGDKLWYGVIPGGKPGEWQAVTDGKADEQQALAALRAIAATPQGTA